MDHLASPRMGVWSPPPVPPALVLPVAEAFRVDWVDTWTQVRGRRGVPDSQVTNMDSTVEGGEEPES